MALIDEGTTGPDILLFLIDKLKVLLFLFDEDLDLITL